MLSRYNHSGGVYRPPQASASSESHQNAFLISVLRPWLGAIAPVPDGRLRGAILKTTHSNTTLSSANSNIYMVVAPFASPRRALRIYAWDSTLLRFYFLQTVEQDEDLSQYFLQLRLVSAGLCLVSSTVTGNTFTVSGSVNGINYYDLPDVFTLTHENLVSFKRNNSGAVAGVPVSDGVTAIAVPDADHVFDVPRVTGLTWNAKQVYNQTESQARAAAPFVLNVPQTIFSSTAAGLGGSGQLVPPNCWGKVKTHARVVVQVTSAPAADTQVIVALVHNFYRSNPATYAEQQVPIQVASVSFSATAGAAPAFYALELLGESDNDTEIGQIYATMVAGNNLTASITSTVTTEVYDVYRDNIQGPGAIYTLKGTNAGQQLSIDAIYNYEVVPNAELARNVPSAFVGSIASQELEVAHALLANASKLGIRFILPTPEYNAMQANGFFDQLSQEENAMAHAASFGSIVAQMARFLKPIARHGLSAAAMAGGRALTPYMGPAAIPLGEAAAGILNKAFSSDDGSNFPPGTRAYAADDQEDPGKKARIPEEPGTPPKSDPFPPGGEHEGAPEPSDWEGDWSGETPDVDFTTEEEGEVPAGIQSFCASRPLAHDVAGMIGQAASMPFLPSLGEIMSAAAPSGGLQAAPPVEPVSHAPIAAFGFDRERSLVTALVQRYVQTGNAQPIVEHFTKLGVVGHRAKMVITVAGPGEARALPAVDLYVTDRPVQRARAEDGVPVYKSQNVQGLGDPIFFDDKLEVTPSDLRPILSMNPLLFQLIAKTTGKVFVTLAKTNNIAGVGGASWHMAFYAALSLCPYGGIFSGSLQSKATDLLAKVSAAAAARPVTQLIVLNPVESELPNLQTQLNNNRLGLRLENPLGDPGYLPILYATGSLPAALLYSFQAVTSVETPAVQAEKAANKAKNLKEAQLLNPNILLPLQKVMIGGKQLEIDISKLVPSEYVKKEFAEAAIAKVSPGATVQDIVRKWNQMIAAKPPMWGSLAQKFAAVESARLSLANIGKPGAPAEKGQGNPANRKRREKEKTKRALKLAAIGAAPTRPAAAISPTVLDVTMSGGEKRAREEERPEM